MKKMGDIARDANAKLGGHEEPAVPYTVRVTEKDLQIRKGPGPGYPSAGYIKPGVYTIVEEKAGWGKLKSGAGWISVNR